MKSVELPVCSHSVGRVGSGGGGGVSRCLRGGEGFCEFTYRGRGNQFLVGFVPLVNLHQILMLFIKVL